LDVQRNRDAEERGRWNKNQSTDDELFIAERPTIKVVYKMHNSFSKNAQFVFGIINWGNAAFCKGNEKAGINNITFNTVHPGSAPTSLGREAAKSLKWRIIYFLWKIMMNTVAAGASSSIKAAVSPELESRIDELERMNTTFGKSVLERIEAEKM
jgi:hypothetical protein